MRTVGRQALRVTKTIGTINVGTQAGLTASSVGQDETKCAIHRWYGGLKLPPRQLVIIAVASVGGVAHVAHIYY